MLDTTPAAQAVADWTATLRPGLIVVFDFPSATEEGASKIRPCLVIETGRVGDNVFAEIAYGTTASGTANKGLEIHVRTPEGMALAGLARPTRFVARRRVIVALTNTRFACSASHPSPVIGRLDDDAMARLNDIRARLWAEKDVAAERNRERRGRTEQGVPIVWRSSRQLGRPTAEAGR
jgi:hypothetical protein